MTTPPTTLDFVARRNELRRALGSLGRAMPEVMSSFAALHRDAMAEGALPAKTKELLALAIGIATNCEGCIAFHVHDALKAGATRDEITETVAVAVMMGGGPATMYGSEAIVALDQFEAELG